MNHWLVYKTIFPCPSLIVTVTVTVCCVLFKGCADKDNRCRYWTKYCNSNNYVKANCMKTCGRCGGCKYLLMFVFQECFCLSWTCRVFLGIFFAVMIFSNVSNCFSFADKFMTKYGWTFYRFPIVFHQLRRMPLTLTTLSLCYTHLCTQLIFAMREEN